MPFARPSGERPKLTRNSRNGRRSREQGTESAVSNRRAIGPGAKERRPPITKQNHLLAALKPADYLRLKPYLQHVDLVQGAVLQEPGERVVYVYFPQSGMISILAIMANGDAVETAMVGSEGTLGALAGVGPWRAVSRAVVQIPGRAVRILATQFQTIFHAADGIQRAVMQFKEALLAQVQQTAACNALHGAGQRLCRWLLHTHDRIDGDVIPLTQEFLSQMLGVTRTTVTEIARELQTAGLIRYSRGRIEVLDRRRLEDMACECYAASKRYEAPRRR